HRGRGGRRRCGADPGVTSRPRTRLLRGLRLRRRNRPLRRGVRDGGPAQPAGHRTCRRRRCRGVHRTGWRRTYLLRDRPGPPAPRERREPAAPPALRQHLHPILHGVLLLPSTERRRGSPPTYTTRMRPIPALLTLGRGCDHRVGRASAPHLLWGSEARPGTVVLRRAHLSRHPALVRRCTMTVR